MLLCVELMFFAVSLNFIFFSLFTFNVVGQIFALFTVTVAATETSIGLSLIVISYRLGDKLDYRSLISFDFIVVLLLLKIINILKKRFKLFFML
jgi:NADH:ubiquinone oxidoreductase subunit K